LGKHHKNLGVDRSDSERHDSRTDLRESQLHSHVPSIYPFILAFSEAEEIHDERQGPGKRYREKGPIRSSEKRPTMRFGLPTD